MSVTPETEVVLLLSNPRLEPQEAERLRELLDHAMDWYRVLGLLAAHRTAGIAWTTILDHAIDLRRHMKPSYFLKGLEIAYKGQLEMALDQLTFTSELMRELDNHEIASALLKGGAVSCMAYRSRGMRQFADNDILIGHADLRAATTVLKELGYLQGTWDYATGTIKAVKRSETLFFAVTSHQTYPYMKATPQSRWLECHRLDVHFSVDLMTSNRTDDLVAELLRRRIVVGEPPVWALPPLDMLIFCCVHFFKEAMYQGEVVHLKDLVLYKLVDVLALLELVEADQLAERASELGLERAVFFTLHYLESLYPGRAPKSVLAALRPDSLAYLDEVSDGKGRVHRWEAPIHERFFDAHRIDEIPAATRVEL